MLAAFVEELSNERIELKCVNDLALETLLRLKLLMRCLHTSHEQHVPGRCFVPYLIAVKHKPQLAPGIELAMVKHDGGVLRAPVHVSLPGMRTRTVVTLYSVDLARPIVLMACSEPRNWFTALARHNGPQVVAITLVDDLLSEYGGRIARHVLTKPSDLLFFAGPCAGGSSWARLNKTRGVDTAEKIEAKQKEFWKLFERFVEIKRHAMTKRAAILFELPGSCDYWKDERLREVVRDGISHEFGCRYGLKQRYAKQPTPIKKPWRVVSWNFDLGSSLSKKCNGNHEHGPCAGRETKETQLYTSLIVGVILRRFRAMRRDERAHQRNLLRWMICGSTPSDISDARIGAINSLMCVSFIMGRLQPLVGERHATDQSYTVFFRQDKNELKDLYREIGVARNFLWCIDMIYKSTLPAMNINSISLAPHAADRAAENQDRRKWVSWLKEIEKKAEKDNVIDFYQNAYCAVNETDRELEIFRGLRDRRGAAVVG